MGSGGAAISLQTLQFFEDIGIPIIEAYGMTETSPVMTCGTINWENRRLGTVGPPIPGIDVKIVEPGTSNVLPPEVEGEVKRTNFFNQ
jgi:long-chain acyl-CoA synthetase